MKINILIALFLFLLTSKFIFSQKVDTCLTCISKGNRDGKNLRQGSWSIVDTVKRITYNCNFIDDTLNGKVDKISEKEKIITTAQYVKGKKEGAMYIYKKNKLIEISYFINDQKTFIVILSKGKPHYAGDVKNNVWDGVLITYYPNGKIRFREDYKNGILNGKQIGYRKNGSVMFNIDYIDGKFK